MAAFTIGDVVTVPYPYVDQSQRPRRPALILQFNSHGDALLCMISTRGWGDENIIPIPNSEEEKTGLRCPSVIRYTGIVILPRKHLVKIGALSHGVTRDVKKKLSDWILNEPAPS